MPLCFQLSKKQRLLTGLSGALSLLVVMGCGGGGGGCGECVTSSTGAANVQPAPAAVNAATALVVDSLGPVYQVPTLDITAADAVGVGNVVMPVSTAAASASGVAAPRFAVAMDDLEPLGPFPSWADAKRDYGAVGDGVTDDAPAIQRALNELGQPGKASVLYLPPGNYKIAASLRWTWDSRIAGYGWGGLSLVGDSPSTTRITWAGPVGGAMLIQDGGYNTRYARITWDGKGKAGYGIAHWWNTKAGSIHDSSSEDVDEVFQDMGIGIMAGRMGSSYGQLNSEGQVRRVTFLRNTYAGLSTGSFNALDWWVFDSRFVDCGRGLTNTFSVNDSGPTNGAGGFYVYRSVFESSKVADVDVGNTGWFSMHQNFSSGSRRFFQSAGAGANASPTIIKGNRIVDTTDPAAIVSGNLGPLLLIDNQVRSAAGVSTSAVVVNDWAAGRDVMSIGNTYTVTRPIKVVDSTDRVMSINDKAVAATAISTVPFNLPSTPQRLQRQVFEVAAGSSNAQIQSAIDAAVQSGAANAVVHIAAGKYAITSSLVVPARARVQIAGDALTTVLEWKGAQAGVIIQLMGPSRATVRDLQMLGANATAIAIGNADQSGGRVFLEGNTLGPLSAYNLNLTQLSLQANPGIGALALSNVQNFVQVGTGVLGPVTATAGSTALIADTWYEGNESALYRLDGGTFTYLGGHMAPASHAGALLPNDPAIKLTGFQGQATFVGVELDLIGVPSGTGIQVDAENAATSALFWGITSNKADYFKRTSSGGSVGLIQAKTVDVQSAAVNAADQGTGSSAFMLKMLSQARQLSWDAEPYVAPSGATDVRIYRVKADQTAGLTVNR